MISVVWMDHLLLCWDESFIDEILTGQVWRGGHDTEAHVNELPPGVDGAVVIVPARYHQPPDVQKVIDPLAWCVVVLTSDEESTFPWADLQHPNMRVWVQTPRPDLHADADRMFGCGAPPNTTLFLTAEMASRALSRAPVKPHDWAFAGQVNHGRRRQCVEELRRLPGGRLRETPGFTQGMPRMEYLRVLLDAKLAPCPSGPETPDSFRVWEALEAGCVPIVDTDCPRGWGGYWPFLLGDVPFPLISDWATLPARIAEELAAWPRNAVRVGSWWQQHKRAQHWRLHDDITELSGHQPPDRGLGDLVTVIIPTSPIPSHPDTAIIDETIGTVREALGGDVEILLCCDGVRSEQAHRTHDYTTYLWELVQRCGLPSPGSPWENVLPVVHDEHLHQAEMTRHALDLVRTPTVLFVEHDTPIVVDEPIDWAGIIHAVVGNHVDVVRLHHEALILDAHQHLMVDKKPRRIGGVPLQRTTQWSQRPAVASTEYYRRIMRDHFTWGQRTMIEPLMHSVAQCAPWSENRIAIYAPGANIKRSYHLDGRGTDPIWEMS